MLFSNKIGSLVDLLIHQLNVSTIVVAGNVLLASVHLYVAAEILVGHC